MKNLLTQKPIHSTKGTHMNPSAMKQAIKQRRGQGLEISIMVNPSQDKKESDLAPPGKSPEGKEDASSHPDAMGPLSDPASPPQPDPAALAPPQPDEHPSDEISPEHEQEISNHILNGSDPHQEMTHAPRSLGERAKMAIMAKMKNKHQK